MGELGLPKQAQLRVTRYDKTENLAVGIQVGLGDWRDNSLFDCEQYEVAESDLVLGLTTLQDRVREFIDMYRELMEENGVI